MSVALTPSFCGVAIDIRVSVIEGAACGPIALILPREFDHVANVFDPVERRECILCGERRAVFVFGAWLDVNKTAKFRIEGRKRRWEFGWDA